MINFLDFYSSEQYLYSPKILLHNIRIKYKFIGIILHVIVLSYISNQYISLYVFVSTLILFVSVIYLPINILFRMLQAIFFYLFILSVVPLIIMNNLKSCTFIIKLTNYWTIVNCTCLKNLIGAFLYSSIINKGNTFLLKILVYFYFNSFTILLRACLIFLSYYIWNQLFFITSTNEEILSNYILCAIYYQVTQYYQNIITLAIILSSNYIMIVKSQISYLCTILYLKNISLSHKNQLIIIGKILILLLKNIIKYCEIMTFVIYYRKSYPLYRKVWFHY